LNEWSIIKIVNVTPRTRKQIQIIRDERKNQIMDTALVQFASVGYHNTTISDIAKNAGISKGLMYNYFSSKEELLSGIISRSMEEITTYFDPNHDGFLSEEEFELFVRKYFLMLREKKVFWRLFFQLILQKDVSEQFLKPFVNEQSRQINTHSFFPAIVSRMIIEYFMRKKERNTESYDPLMDMNMFIYTIEGFSRITVLHDNIDEKYYEKTIDRITEMYK
jgi:AcrR family transcriptional regulator